MQVTQYLLEDEVSLRRQTYHSVSWPPTTVFDKAIYNGSMSYKIFNYFDEDGPIDVSQDRDFKVARLEAFVRTMIGFYTGDLDLTGRRLSRFEFYSVRWSLFLADVEALAPFVLKFERGWAFEGELALLAGQSCSSVYYEMQNEEMWETFRERWLVPSSYVYEDVKNWTDNVVKQITESKGKPKIQKLFLLDLPDELLDLVFQQGGSNVVRLLTRTCRHMRALGASYIYRYRSMCLCMPSINAITLIGGSPMEQQNHVFKCYQQSLDNMHKDIAFLTARPDITKQIEILNFHNYWAGSGRLPANFDLRDDLSSVIASLSIAFLHGESITEITMCGFVVSRHFIRIMSTLPKLRKLCIDRCTFGVASQVEAKILAATQLFNLDSVRHLRLAISPLGGHQGTEWIRAWNILAFCRNITSLYIFSQSHQLDLTAFSLLAEEYHPFHITRLCMDGVSTPSVSLLRNWLLTLSGSPNITHFKVRFAAGVKDAAVLSLLDAIAPQPLKNLVVDGLLEGSTDVFSHISQHFPQLTHLLLFQLLSPLGVPAAWPEPPTAYASQLASLAHLRYFGWNLGDGLWLPPIPLAGVVAGETDADESADKEDAYDDEAPSDPDEITAIFAKQCAALKVFVLHDISSGWDISRGDDGQVTLNKMSDFRRWESMPWNPEST
ncbi:hypothetical protein EDD18DRAFT_1125210 [Armillaria luteobubalina]|uniref:F-box domain-containing protein n=1 Tax=Armillaria luteobubalina TaxID=153913 RepID=A0AA39QS19_9AGAR|nr:hypothetical protein EDD18DRAFT_1125210 [Armillaria luteobubalina]